MGGGRERGRDSREGGGREEGRKEEEGRDGWKLGWEVREGVNEWCAVGSL